MKQQSIFVTTITWLFGLVVLSIGLINSFWGNDPLVGWAMVLLSGVYFFPLNTLLSNWVGFTIPRLGIIRSILGILLLVAALGVGELFDKIDLMLADFALKTN